MSLYRLTYRHGLARDPEDLDADTAVREGQHWVLRKALTVAGMPREAIVRRIPAAEVDSVEGLPEPAA